MAPGGNVSRRSARRRRWLAVLAVGCALALVVAVTIRLTAGEHAGRPAAVKSPARHHARHWRQAPSTGRSRTAQIPILMYHVIATAPPDAPYPGLYVPPPQFAAELRALVRAGYHAVTLDQVRSAWRGRRTLPPRPIVLSFDNGYRTQDTQALPLLRRLGWVGVENLQLSGLPPSQGGLSGTQVRALVAAGWELDTQGWNHADLVRLDPAQLHFQVAVARRLIRHRYHVPANWFCYPSGHYSAAVIAAVRAAGYVGSTTVVPGWARPTDNPYRLPRLRVVSGTSPQALLSLIAASRNNAAPPASYPPGAEHQRAWPIRG